jgi:hypothetical protein
MLHTALKSPTIFFYYLSSIHNRLRLQHSYNTNKVNDRKIDTDIRFVIPEHFQIQAMLRSKVRLCFDVHHSHVLMIASIFLLENI